MTTNNQFQRQLDMFRTDFKALEREIGKVVVGREDVVQGVLTALVAGGHVLLEGLPGVGKSVLVQTLADVVDLSFQRIQCTADLMAADVIGTYVIMETPQGRRSFEFQKGPLFSQIVLADQINRTTPKTQSALLEAMDQASITVSTETFPLPRPYFLLATQNPLDMEGTYPLPEAQIDRFAYQLIMQPPDAGQIERILDQTTEAKPVVTQKVIDGRRIEAMGDLVRKVSIARSTRRWGISLVTATHPSDPAAPQSVRRFVSSGSSPRGAKALVLAAKIHAVLDGRDAVAAADLARAAPAALGHRMVLNYDGQAEGIRSEQLVDDVIDAAGKAEVTSPDEV